MTSEKYAFVMMVQEKWWKEFIHENRKEMPIQSYIRQGAAPPKEASVLLFYVTKPVGELAGHAEFIERDLGEPEEMWKEHRHESVLNPKEHYDEFVKSSHKVTFIRFKNLHAASKPILLSNLHILLDRKNLPRKGFYVSKEKADKLIILME
jgi:predicted transcriptional regulator